MELKIYQPFEPVLITQGWGVPNPAYQQFGFSRHNGIDMVGRVDLPKFPLYCPVKGFFVWQVRNSPDGGGNEFYLISKEDLVIGDKVCRAMLVFMHNEKVLVQAGYEPALGELISVGDSTGFSTGPHLHMGLYRVSYNGSQVFKLDTNDANNSYDPAPFMVKESAQDNAEEGRFFTSLLRYVQWYVSK